MISTMNLTMNYSRTMRWYRVNVTLALDHTYKVWSVPSCVRNCHDMHKQECGHVLTRPSCEQMDKRGNPHFSINVIGPNQSAHRYIECP